MKMIDNVLFMKKNVSKSHKFATITGEYISFVFLLQNINFGYSLGCSEKKPRKKSQGKKSPKDTLFFFNLFAHMSIKVGSLCIAHYVT